MNEPSALTDLWFWLLANSEDLWNLALMVAASGVVAFLAWRTLALHRRNQAVFREVALGERRLRLEELERAYRQLGSDRLVVRSAAVYALERLARDLTDDHGPIFETILAFIRQRVPIPQGAPTARGFGPPSVRQILVPPEADVQAALMAVGRRIRAHDPAAFRVTLAGLNLSGYDLANGDFGGADFHGSFMIAASLSGAILEGADMRSVNLDSADLYGASARLAILTGSVAPSARFAAADLEGADLTGCDLREADFTRAKVARVDFRNAILDQARFEDSLGLPAARFSTRPPAAAPAGPSADDEGATRDSAA